MRLLCPTFKENYRTRSNFFCRERVFDFVTVMLSLLNKISKSLGVEITKFLQEFGRGALGSKQAFSQARYKIKAEAFVDLNDTFIRAYYGQGAYELYRGRYLLVASDASTYELPWEEELCEEFGVADNKQNKQPMCQARAVKIWDVLNQLTISAQLGRYDVGELEHFQQAWAKAHSLWSDLPALKPLLLGDMHYPSFWLMAQVVEQGAEFLFRCRPSFCREIKQFMASAAQEALLTIPVGMDRARRAAYKASTASQAVPPFIQVRALKFTRPNGEHTCLVTSLSPQELDYQNICALYPYRWTEEVSFNFDKNRTEIENFSAKMPQGIRQEWHANILATNLAQLLIEDAQQLLEQEQAQKANKYEYRINRSVALGLLKDEIPKMLFGKETPSKFYKRMIKLLLRCREPLRPGRSFPRERKHRLRFSMNLRRPF